MEPKDRPEPAEGYLLRMVGLHGQVLAEAPLYVYDYERAQQLFLREFGNVVGPLPGALYAAVLGFTSNPGVRPATSDGRPAAAIALYESRQPAGRGILVPDGAGAPELLNRAARRAAR
jgi:hypothetical protein